MSLYLGFFAGEVSPCLQPTQTNASSSVTPSVSTAFIDNTITGVFGSDSYRLDVYLRKKRWLIGNPKTVLVEILPQRALREREAAPRMRRESPEAPVEWGASETGGFSGSDQGRDFSPPDYSFVNQLLFRNDCNFFTFALSNFFTFPNPFAIYIVFANCSTISIRKNASSGSIPAASAP
jgi:hypothetical protein